MGHRRLHRHRPGLETARRARADGAEVILTGRNAERLHLMTNTAVTGATYDIDGGQQLVPGS